jgi:hypothetical protein
MKRTTVVIRQTEEFQEIFKGNSSRKQGGRGCQEFLNVNVKTVNHIHSSCRGGLSKNGGKNKILKNHQGKVVHDFYQNP